MQIARPLTAHGHAIHPGYRFNTLFHQIQIGGKEIATYMVLYSCDQVVACYMFKSAFEIHIGDREHVRTQEPVEHERGEN